MKSIIIIIAIFLVTLTAKADWVKKSGLEQIQLPDSNFFFTKVNDSCTKMLLVSQKNLKLYIVDLASGKIDREQKIPYNFDICDYDFELESFVFYEYLYIDGNRLSSIKNINASQNLYKLTKDDAIFVFSNSRLTQSSFELGGEIYLMNIINHNLLLSYKKAVLVGSGANLKGKIELIYKSYNNLDINNVASSIFAIPNSLMFQDGLFINNEGTGYIANANGFYKITNNNDVNVGNANFKLLDIYDNFVSCKVNDGLIKYVEVNSGKTLNLSTLDTNKTTFSQMSNYKLTNNISESVFFKSNDTMYLLDNYKGILTGTIPFVNGKLYFNKSNNYLFSLKGSNLYKIIITPNTRPNKEILVKQSNFLFDDTIEVSKTDIYFYKNYWWEIDGVKYFDSQPKFQIKKAGSYDVKFNYLDSGNTKTILKEKAILIVDSLKVNYKITTDNGLKVFSPISFNANSNYPNATYLWKTNHCISYRQGSGVVKSIMTKSSSSRSFTDEFYYKDGNSVELIVKNGYQTLTYFVDLSLQNNLSLNISKFSGFMPLAVEFNAYFNCNDCGFATNVSPSAIRIDDFFVSFSNYLSKYSHTFTKPGIYNIKLFCGSGNVNYNIFQLHDSVITVYDPTDIQNFAERKYIFKQDVDGIYCQLEGEVEVKLYDNVGRLVRTYQIENERYIRKEDLERGVYFLSIQTNGNVYHEKVLVE